MKQSGDGDRGSSQFAVVEQISSRGATDSAELCALVGSATFIANGVSPMETEVAEQSEDDPLTPWPRQASTLFI